MQLKRILITATIFGLTGVGAANAACTANPTGVWNLFATETYPGPTSKATVTTCNLTFGAAGAFSGPCSSYHTGTAAVDGGSVSGTITMGTTCDFTGSITIPGDTVVTIKDGHINGNIGAGVATQKTGAQARVLLFNLLKR